MKSVILGYAYTVIIFTILIACFSVISLMQIRFQMGFAMHQAMEKGVRLHTTKERVRTTMLGILQDNDIDECVLSVIAYEQYPNFLSAKLKVNAFGYVVSMERTMVEELAQ